MSRRDAARAYLDSIAAGAAWTRGRTSLRTRIKRLRSRRWQLAQCAIAAMVAWLVAKHLLGHQTPVFAPIAAVVSLGTSYAQRLRRVTEVTIGVSLGVLIGDLLVAWIGQGAWQIGVVVALAMSTALLLDSGNIFINQAAVQSIFVTAILPTSGGAVGTRWTEALVGGAVALAAATVVPAAPLRRPLQQAAVVVRKIADLLRASVDVLGAGPGDQGYVVLADARATDPLVADLEAAADEGMAVVASSPFRVRHKAHVRRMADLVEPLDRALRSTRVLVRQVAVAGHRGREVPEPYLALLAQLAQAADHVADEFAQGHQPTAVRAELLAVGAASGELEGAGISAEAILVQARSVTVDLLLLTGMDQFEASDSLAPLS